MTVLAVEKVGVDDFEKHADIFQRSRAIFGDDKCEILAPAIENTTLTAAMAYVPVSIGGLRRIAQGNAANYWRKLLNH